MIRNVLVKQFISCQERLDRMVVNAFLEKKKGLVDDTALIGTVVASMSAEGIRHHHRTSETLVAYEPQLVMYCPQVVDNGPFVLSIFATPWAVSITGKTPEGIRIMNPF